MKRRVSCEAFAKNSAGASRPQDPGDRNHRCENPCLETELRFCLQKCPQFDGETDGARSPGGRRGIAAPGSGGSPVEAP